MSTDINATTTAQTAASNTAQTGTTPVTGTDATKNDDNSLYSYVFIGVLAVVLILLLYYAYGRFVENSIKDPFTDGTQQERDDPVDDFNLRDAIKELQNIQKKVVSTLSEASAY